MFYSVCAGSPQQGVPTAVGEVRRAGPRDLAGGVDRFVDASGELRLLFPGVLPVAAPFILFRLKREGFSRCRAEATRDGILVTAHR
ncbi:hypothetical protein [Geomesophilobacter sediminis]|uniref:Uncharacterized protein n=1 Tax=Geomesophilobacter sediminis TaxID=2798584 RepID=A0A8J7LVX0_9BACT|nr:hypothetical protein [Geomesophilobacter sediminis]MBJ6726044.1 hypothetical protein [Geomesophilobacter sediminis]